MPDMSLKCEAPIELITPGLGMKQSFTMKGSMQCLFDMEQMSGRGFFELCERLRTEKTSITDLAAIVTAGIKAGGQGEATVQKVAEMIYLTGPGLVLASIDVFMQRLLLGGRDLGELLAEEARAAREKASTSAASSASPPPSSDGAKPSSGQQPRARSSRRSTGGMSDKVGTTQTKKPPSRRGKKTSSED